MRQPKYRLTTATDTMNSGINFFTKRQVERAFDKIYRSYKMDIRYAITLVRMGYFKYTYCGEYSTINGEVYISRNW